MNPKPHYYKNKLEKDGRLFRRYGFEGSVPIWQDVSATQASKRMFYANPGKPIYAHKVSEIRQAIRDCKRC